MAGTGYPMPDALREIIEPAKGIPEGQDMWRKRTGAISYLPAPVRR